jgi:hypothetical protein
MRGANLALRLLVELAAIAALALWGAQATSGTGSNVVLAIAILAVSCVLLALAGHPLWTAALAVVAVANGAILRRSERSPGQPTPSGR